MISSKQEEGVLEALPADMNDCDSGACAIWHSQK
jgi:hypothetical protein